MSMFGLFKEKDKGLRFKTNINCGGCIEKVRPHLDKVENIENWEVDTSKSEKILTVTGKEVKKKDVINAVQEAGFEIQQQ